MRERLSRAVFLSCLLGIPWLILFACAAFAEPRPHSHCWHETPASKWVAADAVCCHDGRKRSCEGHGPHAPGCAPAMSQTFPLLDRDREDLRYDYDRGY